MAKLRRVQGDRGWHGLRLSLTNKREMEPEATSSCFQPNGVAPNERGDLAKTPKYKRILFPFRGQIGCLLERKITDQQACFRRPLAARIGP